MARGTLFLALASVALLVACGASSDVKAGAKPAASACLDQPNELARPPKGSLPCELFPLTR